MSTPASATVPEWTLGWRLKRALDHAGIEAKDMAGELEMDASTVSRWMNDKQSPRAIYLRHWAERCGVPYEWLAHGISHDGLPPVDSVLKRGRLCDDYPSRDEILSLRKAIPMQFVLARARTT